jgi:CBS domain containing-hemolysin-like protein
MAVVASAVEMRLRMQLPWAEIGLVLLLILINAGFAGSEVALISLREGQLRRAGRTAAILRVRPPHPGTRRLGSSSVRRSALTC